MIAQYPAENTQTTRTTQLFDQTNPSPTLAVSVIVPVRNEAHHLARTLEALRLQQDVFGQPLDPETYEVLVLVNNCTDASWAVALSYQQRHPNFSLHLAQVQLPPDQANIGTVRRLLMDEAYRRLMSLCNSGGIIASTDGDTVVDSRWLHHLMAEMGRGVDAVGGRILTHPDRHPVRRFHLRDVTYRLLIAQLESQLDPQPHDPWPRHFQHFGANMAVTCAMYQKAGRLPMVPYLEDEQFFKALARVDARVRHSPQVRVLTSARMQGRVAVGFSEQLRCWATMLQKGQPQLAEPAEAWAIRFRVRQQLRAIWSGDISQQPVRLIARLAAQLHISAHWLADALQSYRYFGTLWQAVEQRMIEEHTWATKWPLVPIQEAIATLRIQTNPAGRFPSGGRANNAAVCLRRSSP